VVLFYVFSFGKNTVQTFVIYDILIIGGTYEKEKSSRFSKKHKMSLFVVLSVIVMLIGLSYAWLQLTLRGEKEAAIEAGSLKLTLDDRMSAGITVMDAIPVSDEEGLVSDGYTFTLENTGVVDSNYELYLDDLELSDDVIRMNDAFIKYQLTKDDEVIGYDYLNTTGQDPNRLLDKGEIDSKQKYTYHLKMWIASTATTEVMDTVFKGKLRVEAGQGTSKGLYKMIAKQAVLDDKESEFVSSSTGINFDQISSDTNGKGVYTLASTKNDSYPVHYYRGAVENNNIKFAGFCWKIVRTTGTGGVKLIYNGIPDSEGYCTNTTGTETTIGKFSFNENGDSAADIGYMYGKRYSFLSKTIPSESINWVFGNDIEWDGDKYTLKDTVEINTTDWSGNYSSMFTKHYTCFSSSNSCTQVGYISSFNKSKPNPVYYIELADGKNIEDAKREMFSNEHDSAMKIELEKWYHENLLDYTKKLEDTVWCNDRVIFDGSLKSKDQTLLYNSSTINFESLQRINTKKISLGCMNELDKFTVDKKNGNGFLTYPIALLTTDEMRLAGARGSGYNRDYYLHNDLTCWSLSPAYLTGQLATLFYHDNDGLLQAEAVFSPRFVRPSVSLAPSTVIQSGNGSSTNPYVIK